MSTIFLLDENGEPITDGIEPITLGEETAFTFLTGTQVIAAAKRLTLFRPSRAFAFAAPQRPDTFYARS